MAAGAISNINWDWKLFKQWFKTRNNGFKWMLIVILVFPFFASTWEMKETTGFSPLQVLGLLVFIFGFLSFVRKGSRRTGSITFTFYIFLGLFIMNHLLVFGYEQSFSQFGNSVRAVLPFVLFFYFRKYLNNI